MKAISFYFGYASLLLLIVVSSACKKTAYDHSPQTDPAIIGAQQFFESSVAGSSPVQANAVSTPATSPRFNTPRTVQWDKASTKMIGSMKTVIVPIDYAGALYMGTALNPQGIYGLNDITRLFIYTDKQNNYHAEQLTFFPDSNYTPGKNFSGIIFVDSWSGEALMKYIIDKNGTVLRWLGVTVQNSQGVQANGIRSAVQENNMVQICTTITGYNYAVNDPDNGVSWSETVCSYSFINDGGGSVNIAASGYASVAGGGSAVGPAKTLIVLGGNNLVADIKNYLQCFTNVAGSGNIYTVSVCVDQPVPGTRQAWGWSETGIPGASAGVNPIDVGHTFMVLNEKSGSTTIRRSIGFYPKNAVTPNSPATTSMMNDDDLHNYDISVTIALTNSQFFSLVNYITQNASDVYNLDSYNCTSFTLQSLASFGINLPSTKGSWLGGSGNDPGDLGEDLRVMSLSANMTRNTVSSPHPNLGTCN